MDVPMKGVEEVKKQVYVRRISPKGLVREFKSGRKVLRIGAKVKIRKGIVYTGILYSI